MKYKKSPRPPFVALFRDVLSSKEWKLLTVYEQAVYIELKSRYDGKNNGGIVIPYSYFKDRISKNAVSRAFKGLIQKEWITKTKLGGLYRYQTHYKLTMKFDRFLK